jgi:hypothetical protein
MHGESNLFGMVLHYVLAIDIQMAPRFELTKVRPSNQAWPSLEFIDFK